MKAILKINDKEIEVEVSEKQLKKLTEKKKSPFARVKENEDYYSVMSNGVMHDIIEKFSSTDDARFASANYCTDKNLLQQQAYRETLNRLLWRWQYENDEPCDWGLFRESKFCIFKSGANYFIPCANYYKQQGTVYFSTMEKAKQAIEDVVKPFMQEHPDFVW